MVVQILSWELDFHGIKKFIQISGPVSEIRKEGDEFFRDLSKNWKNNSQAINAYRT